MRRISLVMIQILTWTALVTYGVASPSVEEQALLQFAQGITNFQAVSASPRWQGWGKDNNSLCSSAQASTYQELLCEPAYPGSVDANQHAWTGITCTPAGHVLCLNLAGWGLQGNISIMNDLAPLQHLQMISMASNNLTGSLPELLPFSFAKIDNALPEVGVLDLSNNSLNGPLPNLWGHDILGWSDTLRRLYLQDNKLTGQLPQLWSDSNSLWSLLRVDLYNNELTGPVAWDRRHMPLLQNLVLQPGNNFCGSVPQNMEGVVRNYTIAEDGAHFLLEVDSFGQPCPKLASQSRLSVGVKSGASVAAALLAAMLFVAIRVALRRPQAATQQMPPEETPKAIDMTARRLMDSAAEMHGAHQHSTYQHGAHQHSNYQHSACQHSLVPIDNLSDNTIFFSCRSDILNHIGQTTYLTQPLSGDIDTPSTLQPLTGSQNASVPGPLWQEVSIAAGRVVTACNADGHELALGQGSCAKVYRGVMDGVYDVAIKKFSPAGSQRELNHLQNEVAILRSCNNKNIVRFHGVASYGNEVWVVMELLERGSLYNALARGKRKCTWYHKGANIALDIARGLYYLHSHSIVHLDLKSPNILLTQDCSAKIADVGLARIFSAHSLDVAQGLGTFHWMAPELIAAGRCTEKADIFSFGVVLYEIVTAEQPIRGRMKPVKVPKQCPHAIYDLMIRCLDEQPGKRPSAAEAVQIIMASLPPAKETAFRSRA